MVWLHKGCTSFPRKLSERACVTPFPQTLYKQALFSNSVTLEIRASIYEFWGRHNSVYNKRLLLRKVGRGLRKQSDSCGQGNDLPGWGMTRADGHIGAWSLRRSLVKLPLVLISPEISNLSSCCLLSLPLLSWQILTTSTGCSLWQCSLWTIEIWKASQSVSPGYQHQKCLGRMLDVHILEACCRPNKSEFLGLRLYN